MKLSSGLRAIALSTFVALLATPLSAWAQEATSPSVTSAEWPATVRGLKLVVPDAIGSAAWGGPKLVTGLRARMAEALGPLVPAKSYAGAQKKLKLSGKAALTPEAAAAAGKAVGAHYVLRVEVTKQGWLYTAQAILINTESGLVQMDFRAQYYKPESEAADRGQRIGKRTVEKLAELIRDGAAPHFAAPGSQAPASEVGADRQPENLGAVVASETRGAAKEATLPAQSPAASKDSSPAPGSEREPQEAPRESASKASPQDPRTYAAESEPKGPERKTEAVGAAPVEAEDRDAEAPGVAELQAPAAAQQDPAATNEGRDAPSYATLRETQAPSPEATVSLEPELEGETASVRLVLSGGAGLLRTYDFSSPVIRNSNLSFALDPLSLVAGKLEVVMPSVPLALMVRGAFRPVRYQVTIRDDASSTPAGSLLDLFGLLGYQVALSGHGRSAFLLTPYAGVRLGVASVDSHPGDVVLASKTLAALGGISMRIPVNSVLELELGADGGVVLDYGETPSTSGRSVGGFTAGADLDARVWVADWIAIAFDNRFTFEQLEFEGRPTRQTPSGEQGRLESSSIRTQDLRSSVGVALRF